MLHSFDPALGYVLLSFITWSVTFAVIVFGIMLRRKILLWDDTWKETIEQSGMSMEDYADDLKRSFEKVRATFRWLGFFLFVFLCLMGVVARLGFLEKPILEPQSVISGLWLLMLLILSVILPAFVNFGVGAYVAETMLLKANTFALIQAREDSRDKKAKFRIMQKAREIKEKRESQIASLQAGAPAQPANPPAAK
jgi:hypothetical protein